MTALSLGVLGTLPAAGIRELAVAAEDAGLDTLWLNVSAGSDVLGKIAGALGSTSRIRFATGVIPLDREPPGEVLARVRELELAADRVTLGIGSGAAPHPVGLVAAGIADLRAGCDLPIVVGALGPRMRRLGAQHADGLLLSWLTPETARVAAEEARADAAGRPAPRLVLYARTAVERAAFEELAAESARYESYPSYAANFARIGHSALDATIRAESAAELRRGIARYDGIVDELVLRAITPDGSVAAIRRLIDATALR